MTFSTFLHYLGHFLFMIRLDLPLHLIKSSKTSLAFRTAASGLSSYAFLHFMTFYANYTAWLFVLIWPFVALGLGLLSGNWGRHALMYAIEPDFDFRSSIILIDVPSNRFCFNDGYHIAYNLNPLRHWREQPVHFLQSRGVYRDGRALVCRSIDYLKMTVTLLQKDYKYIADCLVPMSEQIDISRDEIVAMLQTATRKFKEDDIRRMYEDDHKLVRKTGPTGRYGLDFSSTLRNALSTLHSLLGRQDSSSDLQLSNRIH